MAEIGDESYQEFLEKAEYELHQESRLDHKIQLLQMELNASEDDQPVLQHIAHLHILYEDMLVNGDKAMEAAELSAKVKRGLFGLFLHNDYGTEWFDAVDRMFIGDRPDFAETVDAESEVSRIAGDNRTGVLPPIEQLQGEINRYLLNESTSSLTANELDFMNCMVQTVLRYQTLNLPTDQLSKEMETELKKRGLVNQKWLKLIDWFFG